MPLEHDRLERAWEAAADAWGREFDRHGDADPGHPDLLWAAMLLDEARKELAVHFAFAGWARGWLTARWQKRMSNLVELW